MLAIKSFFIFFCVKVQLLEEEIVGRRSFWRRQRKRESELTTQENKVAKMLMEDEHVTIHVLREYLDGIYESKSKCFLCVLFVLF